MCGIAGILGGDRGQTVDPGVVTAMCRDLFHRGPDDWGVAIGMPHENAVAGTVREKTRRFVSPAVVGLGNTRLSIIDLSDAGHQPMASEDERAWIVYNGEVYNFQELRTALIAKGHVFHSRTDTEVILRLYETTGPDCFRQLNGMFSVAIWDNHERALYLARDRFGVKPLYYVAGTDRFAFASEIKALLRTGLSTCLDLEALDRYLSFLWVPDPDTILKEVKKVPAGHWMRVSPEQPHRPELHRYWTPRVLDGPVPAGSEREIADTLLGHLTAAVNRQCVADVPVGAFLSGGLDSSAVVALMTRSNRAPHCVHSIGFTKSDQKYERTPDDLPFARQLAAELGLRHEEIVLRPQVVDLLPKLVWHLDEPMADPAIIPAYLICQAARPYTKVLLSGMGADELFGGYRRQLSHKLCSLYGRLPRPVRAGLSLGVRALPSGGTLPFVSWVRHSKKLIRLSQVPAADRYIEACTWMDATTRRACYSNAVRSNLNGANAGSRHREVLEEVAGADAVTQMLYLDTSVYLPSHNLNYTDKMSMAASVEVRVPFLDNDLVDYAFRLPASMKIRGFQGKHILRRALEGVLQPSILSRRKAGFAAPIRSWIVNDLDEMIHDLLAPARISRRGLFDSQGVTRMLADQRRGFEDHSYHIWALLTLELWMSAYVDGGRP